MSISGNSRDTFLPQLIYYQDVEGSARWLCNALGFHVYSAVRDTEGVMDYVYLTHGMVNVIIKPRAQLPAQPQGATEKSHYVFVEDVAQHFAQAQAEGAQVVIDLHQLPGFGSGYSCRDAEGLIWSFGSFDPWRLAAVPDTSDHMPDLATEQMFAEEQAPVEQAPREPMVLPEPHERRAHVDASHRGVVAALIGGGVIGTMIAAAVLYSGVFSPSIDSQIADERAQRGRAEAAMRVAQSALIGERSAKEGYQRAAQLIETQLAAANSHTTEALTRAQETQVLLESRSEALDASETMATGLRTQLADSQRKLGESETKLSESQMQWQAVQQSLTEELDKANAAVAHAQYERASLEATLNQRVFSLETSLKDEKTLRQTAEADRAARDAELVETRKGRKAAEASLETALANLKNERQARVEAEQVADKLRTQLAARRTGTATVRKVVRAKPAQPKPQAKPAVAKAPVKRPTKMKVITYDLGVGDIGFQP